MLRLRPKTMAAFRKAAVDDFVRGVRVHAAKFFPRQCESLGPAGVEELARYGIDRAQSYGITSARSVALYVHVMFAFGADFDRDARLPWAQEVLGGAPGAGDAISSMLFAVASLHAEYARGPDVW